MSNPDAARFFGERATWYDAGYDQATPNGHAARARLKTVVSLLGSGPGEVLDVGMGAGRLCAELAELGWTVSGVDAAEEMVAAARTRLPDAADRLIVGFTENLPFDDESFDAVTATGVLEYSDVPSALAEIQRVLRPGGRAIVSYPNPAAVYGVWKSQVYYPAVRAAKKLLRRPHPGMPRGAETIPPDRLRRRLLAAGLVPAAMSFSSFLVVPSPLDSVLARSSARLGEAIEGRAPRWLATQIVYAARKHTESSR